MIIDSTFIVSFLFTFALVFGSLELTKIFRNNAVNVIIALVIALFAAMYQPFTTTLFFYLPYITWLFVIAFLFAFIKKILGFDKLKGGEHTPHDHVKVIVGVGIALIIFLTIGVYYIPNISIVNQLGGRDNIFMIVGLAFLGLMIYSAYRIGEHVEQPKK